MIARGLGLPSDQVARIRAAAAVHDVGKLLTPKAILNKPGRLTDAEFDVIKRHPVDGAEMVAALGDHELTQIVRHHHERLDGAGYPNRLAGEQIPLGARIIAVADTFDAITSARAYRAAARHQKAIDILRAEAGSQLDPEAVRAFIAYYDGTRPTAVWALVTAGARHVVSCLSGDPAAAATAVRGPAVAAAPATVNSKPSARSDKGHGVHRARRRGHAAVAHKTAGRTAPHAARSGGHARNATKVPPAAAPSAGPSHTTAPAPVATTPAATNTSTAAQQPQSVATQQPQTTPPGHAKNDNGNAGGNGNAYGHDNTHGNAGGNGKGNGKG